MDCTPQKKNITFRMDAKIMTKILTGRHTMVKLDGVNLRRSYHYEIKSTLRTIRFKAKAYRLDESQRTTRLVRTIAGLLARELKCKLSPEALTIHQHALGFYDRAQRQQRSNKGNIYIRHESSTSCISKDKAHKKYDFGAQASVTVTKTSDIIAETLSFPKSSLTGC